jgi:hypothetical protein
MQKSPKSFPRLVVAAGKRSFGGGAPEYFYFHGRKKTDIRTMMKRKQTEFLGGILLALWRW